jgi:serine protease AprX
MKPSNHEHHHLPNRFAVIPTATRLGAQSSYSGKGVRIAFLDSGFHPHSDLVEPTNRIIAYEDLSKEHPNLEEISDSKSWQWHGTQTSVAAAGNGHLSDGVYRGLAYESDLVLVKVSENGRITEDNIARGIEWVIENRERYGIRILNISLGGDEDVPCSKSTIDQAAEEAIRQGIAVVVAAGNSGNDGRHSIPPANSPSVITVGGYSDNNRLDSGELDLYHSNFGVTADGTLKPEIIAPAMWIAAPILPGTEVYRAAETLSLLASMPDYHLPKLAREYCEQLDIPESLIVSEPIAIRTFVEEQLSERKIVATHYQHVDGTSFAAPIVSSVIAQMIEANPRLTPATIKSILIATAERIASASFLRQGYGVVNAKRAVEQALTEQHGLQSVGCGYPRVENGQIQFIYHDDNARTVALAGDFNRWDTGAIAFVKDQSGLWQTSIGAPGPGRYEYKFLVDGQRWVEDPNNGMKSPDIYGGLNSVFEIQ